MDQFLKNPMTKNEEKCEIAPKNNLLDLKLNEVWAYRDLLVLLVRRDFVSFYNDVFICGFFNR